MNKRYKIETKNGIICVRLKLNPSALDICNSLDDVAKLKHGEFRLWDFTCGVDLSRDAVEKAASYARSIQMPYGKVVRDMLHQCPNLHSMQLCNTLRSF